jgi:hypothetical protein
MRVRLGRCTHRDAVLDPGGIRLGGSKAAMRQRISELERAAGVPLVLRTTHTLCALTHMLQAQALKNQQLAAGPDTISCKRETP